MVVDGKQVQTCTNKAVARQLHTMSDRLESVVLRTERDEEFSLCAEDVERWSDGTGELATEASLAAADEHCCRMEKRDAFQIDWVFQSGHVVRLHDCFGPVQRLQAHATYQEQREDALILYDDEVVFLMRGETSLLIRREQLLCWTRVECLCPVLPPTPPPPLRWDDEETRFCSSDPSASLCYFPSDL